MGKRNLIGCRFGLQSMARTAIGQDQWAEMIVHFGEQYAHD